MTLKAGTTLGPYRINELVGVGGMGEVYAATDTRLGRKVALKSLPDHLAEDPDRRARFEREARMLASLNHPNVAAIYGIEESGSTPALVLEYVEGPTLGEHMSGDPLPITEAMDLAKQIVRAVAAAHERGIIHRDLKPANVKITGHGAVKVLDFGIAKTLAQSDEEPGATLTSSAGATEQGQMIGTPAYMSPEQAEGKPIDARSDVFALGTMLYEMLCGRRPFEGDTPLALLASVLKGKPVPPRQIRREIPVSIERIILRCLEKDPNDRFNSADELLDALDDYLKKPTGSSRWLKLGAAAIVLVAIGVAGYSYVQRKADQEWVTQEAIPEIRRLIDASRPLEATQLLRVAEGRGVTPTPTELGLLRQELQLSPASIKTLREGVDAPGIALFIRDYFIDPDSTDEEWVSLGESPVVETELPSGTFRLLIRQDGEADLEVARRVALSTSELSIDLGPAGETPEGMVYVLGTSTDLPFLAYALVRQAGGIPGYWIDQHEVTNSEFKQFIDNGGYGSDEYWVDSPPEVREARLDFRGARGQTGPAFWEQQQYPPGEGPDDPVSGVNWHEAAAYCRYRGKELPTLYQWYRPADTNFSEIIAASNFGDEKASVGAFPGLGPYGTYDMAGNVREWVINPTDDGTLRFVLGGSWLDETYQFGLDVADSPDTRNAFTGFRCVMNRQPDDVAPILKGPVEQFSRDHSSLEPSQFEEDEYQEALANHRNYLKADLDESEEAPEATRYGWRKQRARFRAGYSLDGDQAQDSYIGATLFLPEKVSGSAYPAIVFFPGYDNLSKHRELTDEEAEQLLGFILRNNWAVVLPDYDGVLNRCCSDYYHRDNPPDDGSWITLNEHWAWDLSVTIDYLETRDDLDLSELTFLGFSLGAALGPRFIALEPDRIRNAILFAGGTFDVDVPPAVDPWKFTPHVKVPVLMLNGCFDYNFQYESSQEPLFTTLGSAEKEHFTLMTHHGYGSGTTRNRFFTKALLWLDTRLDPTAGDGEPVDPGVECLR